MRGQLIHDLTSGELLCMTPGRVFISCAGFKLFKNSAVSFPQLYGTIWSMSPWHCRIGVVLLASFAIVCKKIKGSYRIHWRVMNGHRFSVGFSFVFWLDSCSVCTASYIVSKVIRVPLPECPILVKSNTRVAKLNLFCKIIWELNCIGINVLVNSPGRSWMTEFHFQIIEHCFETWSSKFVKWGFDFNYCSQITTNHNKTSP